MSTGLTEFLMERIAEDEAAASAVKEISGQWWDVEVSHQSPGRDRVVTHWPDHERKTLAQHFDPARVLAVCDMTRLIMAIHTAYEPTGKPESAPEWSENDWCVGCSYNSANKHITEHIDDCPILHALALPFAGHQDFRDRWSL